VRGLSDEEADILGAIGEGRFANDREAAILDRLWLRGLIAANPVPGAPGVRRCRRTSDADMLLAVYRSARTP
jgi:hypothetical protein